MSRSSAADLPVPGAAASEPVSAVQPALSAEEAKLAADARTARGLCWISFWGQLTLSCVSGVILVFSVTVREGMMPPPSTWLALVGVVTSVISTFLAWTFRRTATALSSLAPGVTPRDFIKRLEAGAQLNLAGMGATILALQAEVGSLLAKTLTSSAANPYAKVADAPVAFDVFTVQASANTIMAHFCSILFINWTLRIINRRVRLMGEALA